MLFSCKSPSTDLGHTIMRPSKILRYANIECALACILNIAGFQGELAGMLAQVKRFKLKHRLVRPGDCIIKGNSYRLDVCRKCNFIS